MRYGDASVRDKVRKLLALAESDFEHEAESAMLKAQELMALHGLSVESIESFDREPVREVGTERVGEAGRLSFWKKQLAVLIAENFRCHVYTDAEDQGGTVVRYFTMIGLTEDVAIAAEVLDFALLYAQSSWNRFRSRIRTPSRFATNRVKEDYYAGFISGLREKFAEQVSEKGLIIVKDQLVDRAYSELNLTRGYVRSRGGAGSKHAYKTGHQDGKSMQKDRYLR